MTYSLWSYANRPHPEPPWPQRIQGFAFSPFRADQDAVAGVFPSAGQIDADLRLLAGKTHAVRTYSVDGTLADVPRLAARHGINVALGMWLDRRLETNAVQIEKGIALARAHKNVVRVIVGNETMLRGDLPPATLYGYLDHVRAKIRQPVSTAEPWDVWLRHPELGRHVDFIAVHLLPYWEGIAVEEAVQHSVDRYEALRRAFPGKRIVIAEVGWPSNGRTREAAVASPANEALFLRRFVREAERRGYVYYVMEAFDQPWKMQTEGAVGAYWGVYDVERAPKFAQAAPVVRIPHWRALAGVSVALAALALALLFVDSGMWRRRGRSFLAIVAFTAATAAVWVAYDYSQRYLSLPSLLVGLILFASMFGVILVLLTEAHEWVEARWVYGRRRSFLPAAGDDRDLPFVSVHVPAYNEPADMLIETLNALARLDYPQFEVIVIDNNTRDSRVWQPVEAHCRALGARFRFYHEDSLAGFKAGALNYALARTDARAGIVAVIDSDYVVEPGWLRALVPTFAEPRMAIVQAPQDYRDGDASSFKAMCQAEYRGFFHIGMITRNERNAIIQHGTMTLVRRRVLEEVGGWAPWCITEDAELGLRILARGHQSAYVPLSFGKGLMPDTFIDYKKQRFRWAYGAMQIMRRHFGELFGRKPSALAWAQRYHFIGGWLPWLADGFNLLFTLAALVWSSAMIALPAKVDPPLIAFSVLPLCLFVFKLAKLLYLYRTHIGASLRQTLGAAVAGLALTHTIGLAVLTGLFVEQRPFFRTPKLAARHAWLRALFSDARAEALLMLALWLAAFGIALTQPAAARDAVVWIVVLLLQSIPYAAALAVALVSCAGSSPRQESGDDKHMAPAASEIPAFAAFGAHLPSPAPTAHAQPPHGAA